MKNNEDPDKQVEETRRLVQTAESFFDFLASVKISALSEMFFCVYLAKTVKPGISDMVSEQSEISGNYYSKMDLISYRYAERMW
ncbi:MAG: hypothetical protein IJI14_13555 [Anaerolineaceae bacterium]|nr:hypothetical protein [Anaerolineaceae bacterium]